MKEFDIKLENIVSFASFGEKLKLDKISKQLENAKYNPDNFPGVIYKIKDPNAATLLFSTGKIVCTGAKSIDDSLKAINRVVGDLRKLGIKIPRKFNTKVENIVASTQIEAKTKLNLEDIAFALENIEYEPEQFPGLVCRINEPRVAFLLFGSGKIICAGARNVEDIHTALGKFKKDLESINIKVKAVKNTPKTKS